MTEHPDRHTSIHYRDLPICAKLQKHGKKLCRARPTATLRRRLGATQSWLCCVLYIGHTSKLFAMCFPRHTAIKSIRRRGRRRDGDGRRWPLIRRVPGPGHTAKLCTDVPGIPLCRVPKKIIFLFLTYKVPVQTNITYNIHN